MHHSHPQSCTFVGCVQVLATVTSARVSFGAHSRPTSCTLSVLCEFLQPTFLFTKTENRHRPDKLVFLLIVASATKATAATHSLRHIRHCPW